MCLSSTRTHSTYPHKHIHTRPLTCCFRGRLGQTLHYGGARTHTRTHTYHISHTRTHTYMHTHIECITYTHTHIPCVMGSDWQPPLWRSTHKHTHTHTRTHAHTHTHSHTHAHTQTRTHTHTYCIRGREGQAPHYGGASANEADPRSPQSVDPYMRYVCMYVCMYVYECMNLCRYVYEGCAQPSKRGLLNTVSMPVYMRVCTCVYACMYLYICVYVRVWM